MTSFNVGDCVRVTKGSKQGEIGTVLRIFSGRLILIRLRAIPEYVVESEYLEIIYDPKDYELDI